VSLSPQIGDIFLSKDLNSLILSSFIVHVPCGTSKCNFVCQCTYHFRGDTGSFSQYFHLCSAESVDVTFPAQLVHNLIGLLSTWWFIEVLSPYQDFRGFLKT
jgi:hypothetical protein